MSLITEAEVELDHFVRGQIEARQGQTLVERAKEIATAEMVERAQAIEHRGHRWKPPWVVRVLAAVELLQEGDWYARLQRAADILRDGGGQSR